MRFAHDTEATTLDDVIGGADIFLGLSAAGVLTPQMVAAMADRPIILALANPDPRSCPRTAKAARPMRSSAPGARTIRTRSTTSLCFPFIFRGALDVGATAINEAMKIACVHAIAELALAPSRRRRARLRRRRSFRPRIPHPQAVRPAPDPELAPAVARAAMETGVATRPITDFAPIGAAQPVRVPLRPRDEAGVRPRAAERQAHRLRRGRGGARAARRAAVLDEGIASRS
jgi:malate dehydrogenase (oxaloacetate-decarboxylating)(NADP+)